MVRKSKCTESHHHSENKCAAAANNQRKSHRQDRTTRVGLVGSGQANAAIFSGLIARYLLKQGKFPDLQVVASYQPALARPIMAAFPKTAIESFNKVNSSIQKLTADGTFRKILANYGQ